MASTAELSKFAAEMDERCEHERKGYHESKGFDDTGCVTPSVTPDICGIVDARNGWIEPGERADRGDAWEVMAEVFGRILRFLAKARTIDEAGQRAWVAIAVFRPSLLPKGYRKPGDYHRYYALKRTSHKRNLDERIK